MWMPTAEDEAALWARGFHHVAGLDEAGRGPWAGPVYAAAIILPHSPLLRARLASVRDSKTLAPRQRVALYAHIKAVALAVGVGCASAEEIDQMGIVSATRTAMHRALASLPVQPDALVIDALALPESALPQDCFPYADARSLAVASAGIVAKVTRDKWMMEVADKQYPGYGFARHKGYGTRAHRENLDRLGVCALHRQTYRPIATRL